MRRLISWILYIALVMSLSWIVPSSIHAQSTPTASPASNSTANLRSDSAHSGAYSEVGPSGEVSLVQNLVVGGGYTLVDSYYPPLFVDGFVIGLADGSGGCRGVGAFSLTSGDPAWFFNNGCSEAGSPVIYKGTVFVAFDSGDLVALQESDGNQLWTTRFLPSDEETGSRPVGVHHSGRIYLQAERYVSSFVASSGEREWTVQLPENDDQCCSYTDSPTFDNGLLFVSLDARTFALDPSTGSVLWTAALGSGNTLTAGDGRLYFCSVTGGQEPLVAIDQSSGATDWTASWYPLDMTVCSGLPVAFSAGRVFAVIGSNGEVLASVDASSGDLLWSVDARGGAPVVIGKAVVQSLDTSVMAFSVDRGSVMWSAQTRDFSCAFGLGPVSIYQGKVMVLRSEGLSGAYQPAVSISSFGGSEGEFAAPPLELTSLPMEDGSEVVTSAVTTMYDQPSASAFPVVAIDAGHAFDLAGDRIEQDREVWWPAHFQDVFTGDQYDGFVKEGTFSNRRCPLGRD